MNAYELIICENYAEEAKRVIEKENFDDVGVSFFPCCCLSSVRDETELTNLINRGSEKKIVLLSKGCGFGIVNRPDYKDNEKLSVNCCDTCPDFFLNKSLIDSYIRQGALIVTSAWIDQWEKHIEKWGFKPEEAGIFLRESVRFVVVLDTGIHSEFEENLEEFKSVLGVNVVSVEVGLDFFRFMLSNLILRQKSKHNEDYFRTQILKSNRASASYAMAFDLIANLIRTFDVNKVVGEIMHFFMMLCAPGNIAFLFLSEDGKHKLNLMSIQDRTMNEILDDMVGKLQSMKDDYEKNADGKGIYFKIKFRDEVFGLVEISSFKFPENIDHYINIAMAVSGICGLALSNAYTYSKLIRTMEQLNVSIVEKDKMAHELQMINHELQEFTYTVSHDLKNPLNIMQGYLMMIRDDESLFKGLFDRVHEQSGYMLELIDSLLNLSRAGKVISSKEKINITDEINIVLAGMKAIYENVILRNNSEFEYIYGDPARIVQVLINVIQNAIQNRDVKKVDLEIEITSVKNRNNVVFCVRDNGKGISQDNLKDIFKPGFTMRPDGTGFGLPIVKKIMEAHGGKITITSEGPDKGTSVYLEFPIEDDV